ncbi:MAG TPA: hypothetical protein VI256_00680 [Roseiarcus sp.]
MWHEAALPGMGHPLDLKSRHAGVSAPIGQAYLWAGPSRLTSLRAEMDDQRRVGVSMNVGARSHRL